MNICFQALKPDLSVLQTKSFALPFVHASRKMPQPSVQLPEVTYCILARSCAPDVGLGDAALFLSLHVPRPSACGSDRVLQLHLRHSERLVLSPVHTFGLKSLASLHLNLTGLLVVAPVLLASKACTLEMSSAVSSEAPTTLLILGSFVTSLTMSSAKCSRPTKLRLERGHIGRHGGDLLREKNDTLSPLPCE